MMGPCFVEVTVRSDDPRQHGRKEYKNLALFETVRSGADGGAELWRDGRCARLQETPAQVVALAREAVGK